MDNERQQQIRNKLKEIEKTEQLRNLDYDVTEKEILNACKKFKKIKCIRYDIKPK